MNENVSNSTRRYHNTHDQQRSFLSYTGYFSDKKSAPTASEAGATINAVDSDLKGAVLAPEKISDTVMASDQAELESAVEAYMSSERFAVALENWQTKDYHQYEKTEARMIKMTANEIVEIINGATNNIEKVTAT